MVPNDPLMFLPVYPGENEPLGIPKFTPLLGKQNQACG